MSAEQYLSQETNPSSTDVLNSDNLGKVQYSQWVWEAKGIWMCAYMLFDLQILPISSWSVQLSDTLTKLNKMIFEVVAIFLGDSKGYFVTGVIG